MYQLKSGIKQNPEKRWNLPDRVFFGHGACHILAGVYLEYLSSPGFYAIWIKPDCDFYGNHVFVTNGETAFDYHGYSKFDKLLKHHRKGWLQEYCNWSSTLVKVKFDLLNTQSLNKRKMLGPNQYLHNPISRAKCFIDKFSRENVPFSQ